MKRLNPGLKLSVDGRYGVDQHGGIWSVDGKQVGVLPEEVAAFFQWADDGPALCRFDPSTGELVVADVHGKVLHHPRIGGTADYRGPVLARCDVASGRAVLWYWHSIVAVSIADASVIGVFATVDVPYPDNVPGPVGAPRPIVAVSPDGRWLAEVVSESPARPEIDVVSLITGATGARLKYALDAEYGFNLGFSPDGQKLFIGDANGPAVRMLDWRSHRQEWSRPGLSIGLVPSDASANRMLVEVWNGLNTTACWIVDSQGRAIQFKARPFSGAQPAQGPCS